MEEKITATGLVGIVATFDGEFIEITRKGSIQLGLVKGSKRFRARDVAAIEMKPAAFAVAGYIKFSAPGANELRPNFGHKTGSAVNDPYAVPFKRRQQASFEALRDSIEKVRNRELI